MLFAGEGFKVFIYDIEPKQIEAALIEVEQQLKTLEKNKMLRGRLNAKQQFECIKGGYFPKMFNIKSQLRYLYLSTI